MYKFRQYAPEVLNDYASTDGDWKLLAKWDPTGHKGIHALDEPQPGDAADPELEELHSFLPHLAKAGSATKEELHAFFRKKLTAQSNIRKPGNGGQTPDRRPAREAPARDARDAKCPNCGGNWAQLAGLQGAEG